ncbi:hypothetical protein ASPSYDRAFT_40030 [Aspergillus sydowii CBS 593.65]|uniref:Secreted protein n=1 Tax=Aspergillus sydowii CBS 593.65 TaxID=1036612 RepID=A0A1L9U0L4_9EURO|nr:uncharacterized protein ASPSYDRAFT_40030 [Aspergillus sydowii CBS 593.65]OJJ65227.1 hypothetical protein ASPSYDRAFT_40030 [Aspergillus sydowii CBS 593.65]
MNQCQRQILFTSLVLLLRGSHVAYRFNPRLMQLMKWAIFDQLRHNLSRLRGVNKAAESIHCFRIMSFTGSPSTKLGLAAYFTESVRINSAMNIRYDVLLRQSVVENV